MKETFLFECVDQEISENDLKQFIHKIILDFMGNIHDINIEIQGYLVELTGETKYLKTARTGLFLQNKYRNLPCKISKQINKQSN